MNLDRRQSESVQPEENKTLSGAFLVGFSGMGQTAAETREYLEELSELVQTLGYATCGELIANVRVPEARYFVGSGKAEEIRDCANQANAEVIVFDSELSASQQRNMEKLCGKKVLDRQEVILDIFAERAITKEAVLQVELARNKYFLPRLTRAWSHLSRQRGGAGGTRGEGEKQLEYDKRAVRLKITKLEEELAIVRKQRNEQRKGRVRGRIPQAAIVGYTNAGKSSLLNKLTGADAFVKDQLFATLDPTTRRLPMQNSATLLLTDTVGFVRKLPHALVEAFKSTLEEAVLADFLVLVLDASSPTVESHRETTLGVLAELGAVDKPVLTVFNKCDREIDPSVMARLKAAAPNGVSVSCATGEGMDALFDALQTYMKKCSSIHDLAIPPERSDLVSLIHAKGTLITGEYMDNGTFICVAGLPDFLLETYRPYFNDGKITTEVAI